MRSRAAVAVVAAAALMLGCTSTPEREQTAPAGEAGASSTQARAAHPIGDLVAELVGSRWPFPCREES